MPYNSPMIDFVDTMCVQRHGSKKTLWGLFIVLNFFENFGRGRQKMCSDRTMMGRTNGTRIFGDETSANFD